MPAADALAALAAAAVHGHGDAQRRAALELTRCSRDPEAFLWWWLWLASTTPAVAAPLVEELPRGLVLLCRGVPAAVDAMTTADDDVTGSAWVDVRSAVLRRLDPQDPGSCDLATLVACSPGTHPEVLAAALALLGDAGHPSRGALLRAAQDSLERAVHAPGRDGAGRPDVDDVVVAATILAGLAPAQDEQQRQLSARCAQLLEECTAPAGGAGDRPDRGRQAHWVGSVLARLRA
ncbi:hypothetical protein FHN55_06180 [Streptomyces sp. NP160]|uniref:hypothetical protein n=1 Tax=Streptomyces sp. NP160 TaxID=2586637 RepID=UPI0011191C2C|nr:hypothetical protein [Streptomyces sp. NP160]TNM68790.1 hypothetical protein FHN55_06180 [Streptomyces sp. NP160]